jgi:hypothetical protein
METAIHILTLLALVCAVPGGILNSLQLKDRWQAKKSDASTDAAGNGRNFLKRIFPISVSLFIFLAAIALILANVKIASLKSQINELKNQPAPAPALTVNSIPEADTNCEATLRCHNPAFIAQLAEDQFAKGNYAYCVLSFYALQQDFPDDAQGWRVDTPFWAAAELAENPTIQGYKEYHTTLTNFVELVRRQAALNPGKVFGGSTSEISGRITYNFGQVERILSQDEKDQTDEFLGQIQKILNNDKK